MFPPDTKKGQTRKTSSLLALLGSQSLWHLDFQLLASTLQRINSCCLKPPTLQYFISKEALGNWYAHPVHILPGLPHFLNAISRAIRKWASFTSEMPSSATTSSDSPLAREKSLSGNTSLPGRASLLWTDTSPARIKSSHCAWVT